MVILLSRSLSLSPLSPWPQLCRAWWRVLHSYSCSTSLTMSRGFSSFRKVSLLSFVFCLLLRVDPSPFFFSFFFFCLTARWSHHFWHWHTLFTQCCCGWERPCTSLTSSCLIVVHSMQKTSPWSYLAPPSWLVLPLAHIVHFHLTLSSNTERGIIIMCVWFLFFDRCLGCGLDTGF